MEQQAKEFSILSYIDRNSDATQRELSEHVGVSLGTINILLKRLVKKGLVKIQKLQPNSVKYFLTPAGIADKLERTYGYIVRMYQEIEDLQKRLAIAIGFIAEKYQTTKVIFFGPQDDFTALIHDLLELDSFPHDICLCHSLREVKDHRKEDTNLPIIIWKKETTIELTKAELPWVNLMEMLSV